MLGSSCDDALDCGTYVCEQNICTKPCDLSMNMGCPGAYECRSDNDTEYFCRAPPRKDSGGCDAGGNGGTLFLLLIFGTLAATLRQRRSQPTRT